MYSGSMTKSAEMLKSKLKVEYPNLIITPSALRSERILTNNTSNYKFELLVQGQPTGTEVRIDQNDVFFATHIGVKIARIDTTKSSAAVLQTYPNETVFPASAGFVPSDLEAIYNSQLSVKIGTQEFIPNLPTSLCRYVPQTQQSAAGNKSQIQSLDGMVEVEKLQLSGKDQLDVSLSIPAFESAVAQWASVTAGTNHVLIFQAHGFLVRGAAQAKRRVLPKQ